MFDITANENNMFSQHMLGVIYQTHLKDYVNAKFWYEKAKENGSIESIFNLGQLSLKLNSLEEAEKYYNEGIKQGCKKCEYMLGALYYTKSLDIYKKLSNDDYLDSKDIINKIPKMDFNLDDVIVDKFNEEKLIIQEDDDEYVPIYILDLKEDYVDSFIGINSEMIIDN